MSSASPIMSTIIITANTVAVPNTRYICNSASKITITLPSVCLAGSIIGIVSYGSGGWELVANSGQNIESLYKITSNDSISTVEVMCTESNISFSRLNIVGLLPTGLQRCLTAGGTTGYDSNAITYFSISTSGNAASFGDLTAARRALASCSSGTRSIFSQGNSGSTSVTTTDYVNPVTTGNATDFGSMPNGTAKLAGGSNKTIGIFTPGQQNESSQTSAFYAVYLSTTSSAVEFSASLGYCTYSCTGCGSNIRLLICGGSSYSSLVTFFNYATKSENSFINNSGLTTGTTAAGACASPVRGFIGGGTGPVNNVQYITFSSQAASTDFCDLTQARYSVSAASSYFKGVFTGGYTSTYVNTIDYIVFSSACNAADHGDLTSLVYFATSCSDSHGGLP